MEILKHGTQVQKFSCTECGCVFAASPCEYDVHDDEREFRRHLVCKCPECGVRVVEYINLIPYTKPGEIGF